MTGVPEPRVITVAGLDITVHVRPRRRTLELAVERDGTVTAAVPPGIDDDSLARMISRKSQWLHASLRRHREAGGLDVHPPREFVPGEGFPFLGRSYRLQLVEGGDPARLNRTTRRMELRRDCIEGGTRHMIAWYRQQGLELLPARIGPWAQRMGKTGHTLRVLDLGYHWGSCNPDLRTVNIHWATMQLSLPLIDYILVHELAHLDHPRHDEGFWRAVEMPMPGYRDRIRELRREGPSIWLPATASRRPSGVD